MSNAALSSVGLDSGWGDDLPDLANRAALQFDSLARGETTDVEFVHSIARRMNESVLLVEPVPSKMAVADPAALAVLYRALVKSDPDTPDRMSDLLAIVKKCARTMIRLADRWQEKQEVDVEEAGRLRDFCIALSACASSFGPMWAEDEPQSQFRK